MPPQRWKDAWARFLKLLIQPALIFGPALWLPWQPGPLDMSGRNQVALLRRSRRPSTPAGSWSPQSFHANLRLSAALLPPPELNRLQSNFSIAGNRKLKKLKEHFTEAIVYLSGSQLVKSQQPHFSASLLFSHPLSLYIFKIPFFKNAKTASRPTFGLRPTSWETLVYMSLLFFTKKNKQT